MKKILSVFVILAVLCGLLVLPATAAQDPMAVKLDEALGRLDYFYDYNYGYMINVLINAFCSWEDTTYVTVPAAEADAVLHKHFVLTDTQIRELRELGNRDYSIEIMDEQTWQVIERIPFFEEDTRVYNLRFFGGFGGMLPEREYWGYVKNGATYDVYYRHITYQFLSQVLPEGTTESDLFGEVWPESYVYQGITYQNGPDGYYAILSKDNFGRKYTVEENGDVIRIISCTDFTQAQCPKSFDDKNIVYDVPASSGVSIPDNDCFSGSTTVKVEPVVSGDTFQKATTAMEEVAQKFVAYEFTATRDNVAVQPSGKLTVTFAIPQGYSDNVKVYYMAADGTLEELSSTVDARNRTVSVQLEHFSTYILAEVKQAAEPAPTDPTEPAPTDPTDPTESAPTEPTGNAPTDAPTEGKDNDPGKLGNIVALVLIGVLALVALAAIVVVIVKKKENA